MGIQPKRRVKRLGINEDFRVSFYCEKSEFKEVFERLEEYQFNFIWSGKGKERQLFTVDCMGGIGFAFLKVLIEVTEFRRGLTVPQMKAFKYLLYIASDYEAAYNSINNP